MRRMDELVPAEGSIVILGHVRPDGDCVGSCLAAYNYFRKEDPGRDVRLVLEPFDPSFGILCGSEGVTDDFLQAPADICLCLDASDRERLGKGAALFDAAGLTVCIDHHHTNEGYADRNVIDGEISSTAELLESLLPAEKIDRDIAECLYLGIVHDTGCFKHSNTSRRTMETAGRLLEYGVSSSKIIDETFFRTTYVQNKLLGKALLKAELYLSGKMIVSVISEAEMEEFGADSRDLDGIVDQLRVTGGVEIALFLYELAPGDFKLSMRSCEKVDVSAIARSFRGGGHVRAAGGSSCEAPEAIIAQVAAMAEAQMRDFG